MSFHIAHLNIKGLRNKLHDIEELLQEQDLDILFLTETKLTEGINNGRLEIPGYTFIRQDREHVKGTRSFGGGLLVYFKSSLQN